jgi:hypothetical protein
MLELTAGTLRSPSFPKCRVLQGKLPGLAAMPGIEVGEISPADFSAFEPTSHGLGQRERAPLASFGCWRPRAIRGSRPPPKAGGRRKAEGGRREVVEVPRPTAAAPRGFPLRLTASARPPRPPHSTPELAGVPADGHRVERPRRGGCSPRTGPAATRPVRESEVVAFAISSASGSPCTNRAAGNR